VQRGSVRVGIRIGERPALQQITHLLAECFIRVRTRVGGPLLCMLRELRQHAQQRIGNGLVGSVGHRTHDVEHRIDRESMGRVDRELRPLRVVAAHLDQSPQGAGL
jgi:hypothetical protein